MLDENIKDAHYLVTRFDNFNFIKFEDRIFSLLDESIAKTNGINEWIFDEIIAKFEGDKAKKWKDEVHIGVTSDSKISAYIDAKAISPENPLVKGVFITDYMDLPWEKEAYEMQETLLIEWKKQNA